MEDQRGVFMDMPTGNTRSSSPMSASSPHRSFGFFDILTRRFGRRSHDDICYTHHGEEDSRSSSTDSCSSTSGGQLGRTQRRNYASNLEISFSSSSDSSSSSSSSSSSASTSSSNSSASSSSSESSTSSSSNSSCNRGSNNADGDAAASAQAHRRSASSLRRALQSFSLSSRSLSCSSSLPRQPKDAAQLSAARAAKAAKSAATNADQLDCAQTTKKSKKTTAAPKRILRQPVSYAYLKGMSGLPTQRVPRTAVCCHYANR